MGYTPTKWEDHILSDNRYKIKQNSDGTVFITSAGKIVQQGTPMSAEKFNNMENGIKEASDKLDDLNREQFSITNTTSARYQYVKLGKVNVSKSGSRAMIQLVGRSSYNDIDAGGKVEIYLSCNDAVNTNNCRIGALVYAYGNSTSDLTVTNTWATEVLVVRAEGYSTAEADIYLKFTSGTNFTSYFAVMEKQDTFKWTTGVEFTNTDPTENAVYSYIAAKKLFRDDYLPMSGGTIYSDDFTPFWIGRASNLGSSIGFRNKERHLGRVGFTDEKFIVRHGGNVNNSFEVSNDGTVTAKRFISTSTDVLLYSNSFTASSATIDIPNLFTNYSAVVCNAVTTSGKYSVTLPLAYIKSLGTSEFYEADGLLFYYVDDSTLTVKTGLGQSNPTINSVKIINLY